jgi:Cellulase (glycosyl hydrolase family 5)
MIKILAAFVTGSAGLLLALHPASSNAASNFTVSASGGFIDPNGQQWTMRGLNAGVQDALQGFPNVMTDYPGMTAIRLNVNPSQDSSSSIAKVVQEYTAAGVVVQIEDHSGNGDNVAWYQQMAQQYKGNPLAFLETPNEPSADPATTAQNQIGIINTIRAAGFTNPIGVQPNGGYDFSNVSTVVAAIGTSGLFVTPHIYYNGTDPNGAAEYVQSDLQQANADGLFASIDEFGNAMDGFTLDPQGNSVIHAVMAANEAEEAGAVFWAMDNGNHPDGTDSAFLNPNGSQLTPIGQALQSWLAQTSSDALAPAVSATPTAPQQAAPLPPATDELPPAPAPMPALAVASPEGTSPTLPSTGQTMSLAASGFTELSGDDGDHTITVSNEGNVVCEISGVQEIAVPGNNNAIALGPFDDTIAVSGWGNTIDAGGGVNNITLNYSSMTVPVDALGNVIVLPSPGTGEDIITGKMRKNDRIDLTQALAGTMWDHTAATMTNFYAASNTAAGYVISVGDKMVALFPDGVPGNDITAFLTAH